MKLLSHYPNHPHGKARTPGNWRGNSLNESLYYSFRSTHYCRLNYPSAIHYHDYFELVVFVEGDMHYLCEDAAYAPSKGDVILIPPGTMHMSVPDADETHYTRHVFYLCPDAFEPMNLPQLTDFLQPHRRMAVTRVNDETLALLSRLDGALASEDAISRAMALGLAIQFFCVLARSRFEAGHATQRLPENVRAIQRYLDGHFAVIRNASDVARHFYYSREYLSRLFRRHFNVTVSDYLAKKRIAHAQMLIARGVSFSEACLQSGFENMGTFIRVFKSVSGLTPSQWRNSQS